jgi:thioredoxin-like negative regulator of GroEL
MKPVVDRLKEQYKGKITFYRWDPGVDQQGADLANQLKAEYVPTFVFFNAKGEKVDMVVGGMDEATLKAKLDSLIQ